MFSLVCVFITVILSELQAEVNLVNNTKIFVHPSNPNAIYIRPPGVRPTSATVEHEPGVPPGWPKPPKRPTTTRRPRPILRIPNIEVLEPPEQVVEMSVESSALTVTVDNSSTGFNSTHENLIGQKYPNKSGVVDWFLGVIGIRPEEPQAPPHVEPPKHCPKCVCGLTYKHTRIVGGVETQVNEYPWMTALMYNNRFYCGASVINNKYLLTAAHCVNGFSKERLLATFLDHDRSNSFESKTFTRKIKTIYRHKYYGSGGNYNNDIALLQLDQELTFNGLLKPVCLPATGKSFTGHKGIATGWGATQEHGQISNKLREVEVPIMSNNDCRRTGYGYKITDNMMCAGYPQGMKDSCQGDSGGPLHVKIGAIHYITGIVSWGEGCAEANYPGVYTRVNRYISWIKSNTRDACYC